jgi:hypothetical protein
MLYLSYPEFLVDPPSESRTLPQMNKNCQPLFYYNNLTYTSLASSYYPIKYFVTYMIFLSMNKPPIKIVDRVDTV